MIKTIVFDFDGVLCEYKGWRGHDAIGKPKTKWINAVKRWFEQGHKLKLSTTRLNPYPFGPEKPDADVLNGKALGYVKAWLEEQGIGGFFIEITGYKPFGDYYIDDKAVYVGEPGGLDPDDVETFWEDEEWAAVLPRVGVVERGPLKK